jgi:hypothetical protein
MCFPMGYPEGAGHRLGMIPARARVSALAVTGNGPWAVPPSEGVAGGRAVLGSRRPKKRSPFHLAPVMAEGLLSTALSQSRLRRL